jgi:hypothetical protein
MSNTKLSNFRGKTEEEFYVMGISNEGEKGVKPFL